MVLLKFILNSFNKRSKRVIQDINQIGTHDFNNLFIFFFDSDIIKKGAFNRRFNPLFWVLKTNLLVGFVSLIFS